MPRVRKLEIVAEGVQRNGKEVDRAVLESVVRNYNPDSRPPVTQGHPDKGADKIPALGRIAVMGVGKNDKGEAVLLCEQHYTPELEEYEDKGYLEGQSVGIYPHPKKEGEYYLHHVAQLGQLPPAAELKTRDVVNLSDDGVDGAFYVFANVGGQKQENEDGDIMSSIKKLIEAVKACSEDEKKALGDALGFEPKSTGPSKPADDKKGDKGKEGEGGDDNPDKGGNKEVTEIREQMGEDRRERLTELADARKIPNDARVRTMIKNSKAIELCNNGDDSRFGEIKALIEDTPEASSSSSELFGDLELADDGSPKGVPDLEGW
ncbi:hypothetical protein [Vibrio parahaemolyticus]|uniref:hypothetical protein n=1 Tax=Vibrio parahaemolyticus TaxID=670 RepID=UPI0004DF73C4|nr:hypothetical protein [Vibrio parahaemolyticus]